MNSVAELDLFLDGLFISAIDAAVGQKGALLTADCRLWGVSQHGQLVGYAAVRPVTGLPHLWHMWGGVLPAYQRRGVGRALLAQVAAAAHAAGKALSAAVPAGHAAGQFLQAQGFAVEHEEVLLALPPTADVPPPHWPDGFQIMFQPPAADGILRTLYRQAFTGHPWYQPYGTQEPVPPALFVEHDLRFVAFAGLMQHGGGRGQIEPLGVVPSYQRQGVGRQLLLAAIAHLRQRGCATVLIGTWGAHTAALNLYQQVGFVPESQTDYWEKRP